MENTLEQRQVGFGYTERRIESLSEEMELA